jgi:hypothetical protein
VVTLRNTLLAANTGDNCSTATGGSIADGGGNLEDGTGCGFTDPSSQSNASPGLDPGGLKDNGGPTQTIALFPGSQAIDRGVDAVCTDTAGVNGLDQRGETRPRDGDGDGTSRCDAGAFELNPQSCRGRIADISVVNGIIVGGLDNGAPYAGVLRGTDSADVMVGTSGADSMSGAAGADLLCGAAGRDRLRGGPGRDRLFGGGGRDRLSGGRGNDFCSGGAGRQDTAGGCERVKSVP